MSSILFLWHWVLSKCSLFLMLMNKTFLLIFVIHFNYLETPITVICSDFCSSYWVYATPWNFSVVFCWQMAIRDSEYAPLFNQIAILALFRTLLCYPCPLLLTSTVLKTKHILNQIIRHYKMGLSAQFLMWHYYPNYFLECECCFVSSCQLEMLKRILFGFDTGFFSCIGNLFSNSNTPVLLYQILFRLWKISVVIQN